MNETVRLFIYTILAEMVAGVLLIIFGGLLSKKARWVLTATLGRLLDIDVEYVFRNKSAADEDIREEMSRSSFVCLLTGRGNELQRDTFRTALEKQNKEFKILLPSTSTQVDGPDWTRQREAEVATFDPAFGTGILSKQIETNVHFLSSYLKAGNVKLKRFNYPHIGRILITDRAAYFTPYRRDAHGRDSNVIKYHRGEMYDCLMRLFQQLWTQS